MNDMVIFFGAPGSGKSMQGQLMAVRHGWRWLSAGQLLRDGGDPAIHKYLKNGELVPDKYIINLITGEIEKAKTDGGAERIILDGFPRLLDQAKILIEYNQRFFQQNGIALVVVFEVTEVELKKRLALRGRVADSPEIIKRRIKEYEQVTWPILDYFKQIGAPIEHINGVGSVGEVHDRIEKVLEDHKITGAF